ncbi:hypothetical protein V9T40_007893 [Parthenolecanium corni]|uniref:U3 small nucleolar RNA-associated protein 13 C-terminal domain-containing protein n=1 Tax=Parthenolecanium corni TaxID=536013 RepID=A0AAN9Y6J9_9HEMI
MCINHLVVVNVDDAPVIQIIPPNLIEYNYCDENDVVDDPVLTFALSSDDELLASGHKRDGELLKSWKGQHKGPLMKLAFNETGTCVASHSINSTIIEYGLSKITRAISNCEALMKYLFRTAIAHDQAIDSICLSMSDDLIATGSQDKTEKLWSVNDLSLVGIFRGHIRAVWCVKFSPVDQVHLTSSANMTLRLRSITELRCLKTIEGHDCSVLNCAFFNNGTQIVSCGNDGLVKVWTIENNECVSTLDKHASEVLAIAVSSDNNKFVTGGTDSRLVFWRDTTAQALQYAITLDRPLKVFKIIGTLSGKQTKYLETVIGQLNVDQKETIIKYASEWNKNSRNSYVAQLVLSSLMPEIIVFNARNNRL